MNQPPSYKNPPDPGWYVYYRIPALVEGELRAGPYEFMRLAGERDDICGYEGVEFIRFEKH